MGENWQITTLFHIALAQLIALGISLVLNQQTSDGVCLLQFMFLFLLQPLDTCGNWAWASQQNGGHADKRYRYTLTTIDTGPESRRALGYARRRRGRGGRVIFDRAYSEQRTDFWDKVFDALVPNKSVSQSEVEKRLQKAADNEFIPITEPTSDPLQPQFRDFVSEQKWFVLFILIHIIHKVF